MQLVLLILILLFGLLLRIAFAAFDSSDDWNARRYVQIQEGHKWINRSMDDSVLEGNRGYPLLQHFLVSRFPRRYRFIVGCLLGPLYDVIIGVFVFLLATILSYETKSLSDVSRLDPPLIATLLFMTSPILLPATARVRALNGRSLGFLFVVLFFGTIGWSIVSDRLLIIAIAIIPGLLIILSSQFAIQVMVFFSVVLSIYYMSFLPFLAMTATLILGFLFPGIGCRAVLRQMLHHKIWYFRNADNNTTATNRNKITDLIRLPVYLFTAPLKFLELFFVKITPIIAFYSVPIVSFLFYVQIQQWIEWQLIIETPASHYLWGIVLASSVVFILVSIPKLSFLGQAERYFEYSSPAFCILFALLLDNLPANLANDLLWVLLLCHLSVIAATFVWLNITNMATGTRAFGQSYDLVNWLIAQDTPAIATVPCKLAFLISGVLAEHDNYKGKKQFYYQFTLRDREKGFRYFEEDTGGYIKTKDGWERSFQVFKVSPRELANKYGISHLIIETSYISGLRETWGTEDGKVLDKPIYSDKLFKVYQIT